jgi:hypothetical protein
MLLNNRFPSPYWSSPLAATNTATDTQTVSAPFFNAATSSSSSNSESLRKLQGLVSAKTVIAPTQVSTRIINGKVQTGSSIAGATYASVGAGATGGVDATTFLLNGPGGVKSDATADAAASGSIGALTKTWTKTDTSVRPIRKWIWSISDNHWSPIDRCPFAIKDVNRFAVHADK